MSMAKYGGGRYFQATNENAILAALRQILVEIQSVNSVFAATSLPISATNRSQNENQVFIGMFRPDGKANPRWYGNLKRYQVKASGGDLALADKNGNDALSATTGFIQACAVSYYTTDSGRHHVGLLAGEARGSAPRWPAAPATTPPMATSWRRVPARKCCARGMSPPTRPHRSS
jgi:hypothetical protein